MREGDEIPSYQDTLSEKEIISPTISKDCPFQLEISPEKMIIPPSGRLEVTIKNPSKKKFTLWLFLISLYFEFEFKNECKTWKNWTHFIKPLGPGATITLTIKVREEKQYEPFILGYAFKTPEGFFKIAHENYSEDLGQNLEGAEREYNPIMEEETEPIKKMNQKFLKFRKIQNRLKRWKEMAPNGDLPQYEKMKRMIPRPPNFSSLFLINWKWQNDLPPNFEETDNMTDEDLKKMKTATMETFVLKYEKCVEDEKMREKERMEEKEKIEKEKQLKEEEEAKKNLEVKPVEEPKRSVVQKTSESTKPVSTVSEVKKRNVKVDEVKPQEQGTNSVVAKKQMKKKKNPCCVVM